MKFCPICGAQIIIGGWTHDKDGVFRSVESIHRYWHEGRGES